jgi:putative transcriptional regulator
MARRKVSEFEQLLLESADEAVAIARGELAPARREVRTLDSRDVTIAPPPAFGAKRVKLVRKNLRLSQPVFAELLNVSVSLVRAWERGVREPEGASQRLLQVAERKGNVLVQDVAVVHRKKSSPDRAKHVYLLRERAGATFHAKQAPVHRKRKGDAR